MSLKPRRVDFNQTWNDLRNTIEDVITLGRVERNEWNSRFVDIYTICVAHPEPLADKLYAVTKSFLEEHVKNLLNTKVTPSSLCTTESNLGNDLLHRYHEVWLEYSKGVEYLNYLYF
uniref:Cullin-2 n=1 Tax=Culex pipiens TaxID=7175 RepID=A0A8D8KR23_CULPI